MTHQSSYKLSILYLSLSFLHLVSSSTLIILSQLWQSSSTFLLSHDSQTIMRFIILKGFYNAALALGIYGVLTVMIGLCGLLEPRQTGNLSRIRGLAFFTWTLFVNLVFTIAIASFIWFWTLRERNEYVEKWNTSQVEMREFLQDHLKCCGYWNSTNSTNDGEGFCAMMTTTEEVQGCVDPIALFADNLLSNIFTFIYALTIIQFSLILTTRCLVITRKEQERYRILDEKKKKRDGSMFYL